MIRRLLLIFTAISGLLCLSGCDVHEFPDVETQNDVRLHLTLDYSLALPLYQTVNFGGSRYDNPSDFYDVRYTLNFYPYSDSRDDTYSRTPAFTRVLTRNDVSKPDASFDIDIPRGNYHVIVWTDYVEIGTTGHLYYNPDDFAYIQLHGEEHHGNTDFRDAFQGHADIDAQTGIPEQSGLGFKPDPIEISATIHNSRPLGKYNIISTDLEKFISRAIESRESRAKELALQKEAAISAGQPPGTISPEEIKPTIDLSDFTVVVRYPMYMPSAFNAFTNKPTDSKTSKSFKGKITANADGNAELGFDYVFVNGAESGAQIAIDVYDYDGTQLAGTGTITVPLLRSKLTTVTGEFLTVTTQGGVGINPGFNGDFNLEIK